MKQHRTAARWIAGLVVAGAAVFFGGVAPAQADTGWNGTFAPSHPSPTSHQMRPADTGWNGT